MTVKTMTTAITEAPLAKPSGAMRSPSPRPPMAMPRSKDRFHAVETNPYLDGATDAIMDASEALAVPPIPKPRTRQAAGVKRSDGVHAKRTIPAAATSAKEVTTQTDLLRSTSRPPMIRPMANPTPSMRSPKAAKAEKRGRRSREDSKGSERGSKREDGKKRPSCCSSGSGTPPNLGTSTSRTTKNRS